MPQSLPQIKPITSLRGVAALSVLVHHLLYVLTPAAGVAASEWTGVFANGYLWVDFFFILSGFILTLAYAGQIESGQLRYRTFLIARLARIYPVHIVMLVLFVLLEIGRAMLGLNAFGGSSLFDLLRSVLLLHSVQLDPGFTPWNGPSWSISAEWIMYLGLPLVIAAVGKLDSKRQIVCMLVAFLLLWPIDQVSGRALDVTGYLGIARCYLEATIGSTLAFLLMRGKLDFINARGGLVFALALVALLLALHLDLTDLAAVLPMGLLIVAATSDSQFVRALLATKPLVYLGQISYSVYMTHWFIFQLISFGSRRLGVEPDYVSSVGQIAIIIGCAVIATMIASVAMYHLVETPMRARLKAWFR